MRFMFVLLAVAALIALPARMSGQTSRINTMEPPTVKAGDIVTATGEGIDKSKVVEVYLTTGNTYLRVQVLEQSDTTIKFKVPDQAKPGRWAIMLKTGGRDPKLLEQPVKITIE